ncbi:MAG TPA: outer membrane beta-barrel protein, partial [Bacteroidia bacterium]|nr:outer membrane beta-barrel protein [Bacteroidia bacterium]
MNRNFLSGIIFSFVIPFAVHLDLFSQTDSSIAKVIPAALKFSGYVDAYYAYYTDSVGTGNYQQFPSISPRSNAFGLNTAMLTAQYDGEKVRGVVTLHYGDIARCAWSSTFNPVMEAHVGVRLCKNNKLWLDAGFFRTHFGTEGLLPKENFASAVSVNTYYEPYFESGIRLNYNPCDKVAIYVYALNGYNMFEDNNNKKSLGTLATYALGDKGNFGYSNYIGDDSPQGDTVSHLRIHQNLFFNY